MKKLIYLIGCAAVAFLGACTTEVDDVFDKSAAQRLDEAMTECRTLLTSASNGWVIAYYPGGSTRAYGGFNLIAKFDTDGYATVGGESAMAYYDDYSATTKSHYSFTSSNSVVLTFDTYNDILHYFSDPDVGDGKSLGGDFEFTYVSGTSSEMIFKGTKTGNIITFTAMDAGVTWKQYLDAADEVADHILVSPYAGLLMNEGQADEVQFIFGEGANLFTYVPDASNPDVSESMAFVYTMTGFMLYDWVQVGNIMIRSFDWDNVSQTAVSTDAYNVLTGQPETVTLTGMYSDAYVPYVDFLGAWRLYYNNGSSSVAVTLSENAYNSSYTMTGLTYPMNITYSKMTGNLSLTMQAVGTYNGNTVYVTTLVGTGSLYPYAGAGYDLIYGNRDAATPILTITNNGAYAGDGLIFYYYNGGYYSRGTVPYLTQMVKQ